VEESKIRQSIKVKNFNWGNVVSLRWSDLGYAPGGDENYLLPANGNAIALGFLRFNWEKLKICPRV
jgi:hypothetical protein